MKSMIGFLKTVLAPYRVRKERRPVPEFVVYYPEGTSQKLAQIKDISSTGVFLLTDDRWSPGTHIRLTVQRDGPFEENPTRRVTLNSRVVRSGKDGVGLAFKLPSDIDFNLWASALANAADTTPVEDVIPPLRLANALEFLGRLCPASINEIDRLVCTEVGNMRVENAVQIALDAESRLALEPDGAKLRANPQTVMSIIANGSWADEEWVRQLWVGLLAASCAIEAENRLDSKFAEILSLLAPIHLRILVEACTRAKTFQSEDGEVEAHSFQCEIREIQRVTGVQSLAKVERDVFHLADLGLLEPGARSESLLPPQEIGLKPSRLGLRLFALCKGHRGRLSDFYATND